MSELLFQDSELVELMAQRHHTAAELIDEQSATMPESVDGGVLETHILQSLAKIASIYGPLAAWSESTSQALTLAARATVEQEEEIAQAFREGVS